MNKKIFTNAEYLKNPYLQFFNYQNVKGSHSFRYHRKGVQKHICCKDLNKAKTIVLEFCKELEKHNGKIPAENQTLLTEYGRKWLDIMKKPYVNKDTYRVYNGVFMRYILPAFNKKAFGDISLFDLQEFFNNLPEDKGKTREDIKIVLSGIYKTAFSEGIIDKNIMECVTVKKHIRKAGKCLTKQEEKDFIEKIKGNTKELSWLILLYSGVRPCELTSIVFNWDNNTMTIKNGKLKSYQTNYYRTIPIFPLLKQFRQRLETEEWKKNSRTMSMRFPKYCPNYRLYDLRHTFITRAKECGVSDEVVNLWTGHTAGKTVTANTYTHFSDEYYQKEALKVNYEL